jgi:hypothetical protein
MEQRAVLELVGGDPPAAAVVAGVQRDALGLGAEQAGAEVAPGIAKVGQSIGLDARAVGLILFGDQQAVVGFVAP